MMEDNDPEGVVAEQRAIQKHVATQVAGRVSQQKCTQEQEILEVFGPDNNKLEIFDFVPSHNAEENGPVFELQEMVTLSEKRVKAVLVTQTLQDIRQLDSGLAVLTNKVGFDGSDVAPRSVMEQVESLLTHVKKTDTKVVAVEAKVDATATATQVRVACDTRVNGWIALY